MLYDTHRLFFDGESHSGELVAWILFHHVYVISPAEPWGEIVAQSGPVARVDREKLLGPWSSPVKPSATVVPKCGLTSFAVGLSGMEAVGRLPAIQGTRITRNVGCPFEYRIFFRGCPDNGCFKMYIEEA
jgi:hypothetical protein